MNDLQFQSLLMLFMASDPWPPGVPKHFIEDLLDDEAHKRGYTNWLDAYHRVDAFRKTEYCHPKSKNILSLEYDVVDQKLAVRFIGNGKTYTYSPVPFTHWRRMIESPSVGQYFTKNIKDQYEVHING